VAAVASVLCREYVSGGTSTMSKIVGIEASTEKRRPSTESLRRRRRQAEAARLESAPKRLVSTQRFAPRWLAALDEELARRYAGLSKRLNEYGYDPFGFDESVARYPALLTAAAYRYWFRAEARGLEHVPAEGAVLVVANHAGNTFAWDAAMIGTALLLETATPRLARGLGEFFLPTIPFFNEFMARAGSVVGTPENCRQLFEHGECVMVFPEGARGFVKPYTKAYQLQRFGLGFMRLALEHQVPILPVGVVGSEEQSPGVADVKWLGRLIGSPAFPITVTLPWFGPLGFVPLPVKFRLTFGPLMHFHGDFDTDDAELQPKVDQVKGEINRLIQVGLSRRRGWFF
jgi:1-acyl-sn-glycerol-3-phosphate acyltransferase